MRTHQDSGSSAGSGSAPSVPSLHSVQEEGVEAEGDRHRIDVTPEGYGGEKDDRETVFEDSGIVGEDALQDSRPAEEESWGDSFAVKWLCTDRVPFHRVKHLRNPWNRDREIKISRDGTELEPSVGQRLLDEWEKLSDPQLPPSVGAGKPATIRSTAASKKPLQALEEEIGGPGSGVGGGSKGL